MSKGRKIQIASPEAVTPDELALQAAREAEEAEKAAVTAELEWHRELPDMLLSEALNGDPSAAARFLRVAANRLQQHIPISARASAYLGDRLSQLVQDPDKAAVIFGLTRMGRPKHGLHEDDFAIAFRLKALLSAGYPKGGPEPEEGDALFIVAREFNTSVSTVRRRAAAVANLHQIIEDGVDEYFKK